MKVTRIAWIPKDMDLKETLANDGDINLSLYCVYFNKGKRDEYNPYEWPPQKVRVTVETVE